MAVEKVLEEKRAQLSPAKRELLEQRLRGKRSNADRTDGVAPRNETGPAPLSFTQQRLWFLHELDPDNPAYNEASVIRVKGQASADIFERTLLEIVRRHEIYRTTFQLLDGEPAQIVAPSIEWTCPVVDLSSLPPGERERELQRLTKEEARRPFNLKRDLPWRATLVRLSEDERVFFFTQHHIICDGWSVNIFNEEFLAIYTAFNQRKPSALPDPPLHYADFASWQRQKLQGDFLNELLAYWKPQLSGLETLQLPTDWRRPPLLTSRGTLCSHTVPRRLTEAIKEFSRQEGTTDFMTVLAAFKVLLHRYTGQTDITVGTPIANRNRSELERVIGVFVNSLVLRTKLSSDQTFRQLVHEIRGITIEAYAHQDMPIEHLIAEIPHRDLSRSPLFQVLFVWQNMPQSETDLPGLEITSSLTHTDTAKFELSLYMEETDEGLQCDWEYNTALFSHDTVLNMANQLQVLLESAMSDPDLLLSELTLQTESERQRLLRASRGPATGPVPALCMHELFEAQVEQTPDATALICGERRLSYRELNRRANQMAHYLRSKDVTRETLVAVCLERSIEMIVAMLGVLKAGGAYVPLDPAYPKERLTFMLEDSGAPVLLAQEELANNFSTYESHLICLDADWNDFSRLSTDNPATRVTSDNLAYVIYTSGSTGRAKGVAVQHDSLVSYSETARVEFKIGADDRVLQFASISFDTAAEEIFPCLTSGATLVLRTDHMLGSTVSFWQKCQEWSITVLDLPTAYWHELALALAQAPTTLPPELRLVIIGGEKALPERLENWCEHTGQQVQLLNTYGPTEATIVSTMSELSGPDAAAEPLREVPIGRAIRNVQAYVLDQHLRPTAVNVPGELYIGGAGLARSYLKRPRKTAERFIPDPFGTGPGARLYRTGDLVRYRPDGNIEFLGRVDHQVKIRGFRVELGEVEAVLMQHAAVQEAVVLALEDETDSMRLVAFVVRTRDLEHETGEIHRFVRSKLPEYMVPAAFVTLDALPLTPNGKVNRKALEALPVSDRLQPASETNFVAPSTPTEEKMAEIWRELLQRKEVGIRDNFFELGGHSLLGTRLISRIRESFQVELPLRALFEEPTIAGLLENIEAVRWAAQELTQEPALPLDDYEEIEL